MARELELPLMQFVKQFLADGNSDALDRISPKMAPLVRAVRDEIIELDPYDLDTFSQELATRTYLAVTASMIMPLTEIARACADNKMRAPCLLQGVIFTVMRDGYALVEDVLPRRKRGNWLNIFYQMLDKNFFRALTSVFLDWQCADMPSALKEVFIPVIPTIADGDEDDGALSK